MSIISLIAAHKSSDGNFRNISCELKCLTGGKRFLNLREHVSKLKIILQHCLLCVTTCLFLLCRWRWMQTISAIAHAPKVSAQIHTKTHTSIQGDLHSLTRTRTYSVHTHRRIHRGPFMLYINLTSKEIKYLGALFIMKLGNMTTTHTRVQVKTN